MMMDTIPYPSLPVIDSIETRWAAGELDQLLRQISPDSVTAMVLRHARQELQSLAGTAPTAERAGEILGPIRVRVSA